MCPFIIRTKSGTMSWCQLRVLCVVGVLHKQTTNNFPIIQHKCGKTNELTAPVGWLCRCWTGKKTGRITSAVKCAIIDNSCSALRGNWNMRETAGISGRDEQKRRESEMRGRGKRRSRGEKKGGDGLNRHQSAVSNERKSDRGERRARRQL